MSHPGQFSTLGSIKGRYSVKVLDHYQPNNPDRPNIQLSDTNCFYFEGEYSPWLEEWLLKLEKNHTPYIFAKLEKHTKATKYNVKPCVKYCIFTEPQMKRRVNFGSGGAQSFLPEAQHFEEKSLTYFNR